MRLICPNCDAQYEVADDAIPEEGRDVQCSSCGHAWYQLSPEVLAAQAAEAELYDAPPRETAAPPEVSLPAEPVPPPPPAADLVPPASPADPAPSAPPAAVGLGRALDEGLMAVLREEADREVQARARDENRLETQGELGLAPAPISAAARRIAQLKGVDPDAVAETVPEPVVTRPPKGKDLLPDIEEINSTLSPAQQGEGDADLGLEGAARARQGGFRLGFGVMLCLAVLIVVLYLAAPGLAEKVPALSGVLHGYVGAIDAIRLWLDDRMQAVTSALQG
ncbi:zinc-ribbon domain-containing protein [Gemmobacter serpentinus]|uniref:zinc-ribbon domain-containing protein n=1 Tax=Gemmobacter serpentinus TaxID=2652247 RepID=UPI0018656DFC|nr:zinc-ribbon domain-containing protein [Gemmobacter serpentinus]